MVGPVCETGDTFSKNRSLSTAKSGDLFAILTCGAYGSVMSSTYNTRMLATEILVSGDKFSTIKHRPDYEDIIAQDIIPDWV